MKHIRAQKSGNPFRRFAGWCGLLLYVLTFSPVGMAVTSVLGAMDADHHAVFQSNAEGMRLVLRHEGDCARHQHHAVARVLTWFACPTSPINPDHVLQFGSATSLVREWQAAVVPPNPTDSHITDLPAPSALVPVKLLQLIPQFRPPPDDVAQRCCPRSAVLLI